ncbi:MAG: isoprenylcysteine carboxylmethyltransferase family protein [Chloroflexi bacterium]|nr:isoprenylcysteine carboxylmethyltransferase family protein [Chloroflexota bacterium]
MLLVLLNTVAVVLFVVRRDASRVGNKLDAAIAFAGTFVLALLRGPELRDTEVLPTIIQTIALMGWATSLMALGRSFGLVAADRGLVRHGPYRFVRHPIYAFEGLFSIGYIVAVPTFYTAILMTIWGALQVIRILREERILSGYEEYKRQVPWRILPGVW